MAKWNKYRFTSIYRTRDAAFDSMEDSYADGEIDRSQSPEVLPVKDHRGKVKGYAVFLTDTNLRLA
jgi:hypothetical protein